MSGVFRKNVGAIIINPQKQFLICQRADTKNWQFPQGGVDAGENPVDTLFREMYEEIGTTKFKVVANTDGTYKYKWPSRVAARNNYIGQEQRYYLLCFLGDDNDLQLDQREFQDFMWVSRDEVLQKVEHVRTPIYKEVLAEFDPIIEDLNM